MVNRTIRAQAKNIQSIRTPADNCWSTGKDTTKTIPARLPARSIVSLVVHCAVCANAEDIEAVGAPGYNRWFGSKDTAEVFPVGGPRLAVPL